MVKLDFRLINCYIAVLLKNREQSQLTGILKIYIPTNTVEHHSMAYHSMQGSDRSLKM